jgi:anti-sigma regulatory factor (Ser/Thr protein kinase)
VTSPTSHLERFPSDLTSVALARAAIDRLDGQLADEDLRDARLLVSELVTNAVRHVPDEVAAGVELEIALEPACLRVEVRDGGPGFRRADLPRHRRGAEQTSGWGLMILDRLASRWGAEADGAARVWFELDLDADARAG